MAALRSLLTVLLVVAGVLVYLSAFVVEKGEVGVKYQFSRVVQSDIPPGLHFKLPLAQTVRTFDARIRSLSLGQEGLRLQDAEGKPVLVNALVNWRVVAPELYATAVKGDSAAAAQRLTEVLRSALRGEVSSRSLAEIVAKPDQLLEGPKAQLTAAAKDIGIELVGLRVQRVELPEDLAADVFKRMTAERAQEAQKLRALGQEEAERIKAEAERVRAVTLAEAQRDAERARGEGDAKAAAIYADAYSRDPEFFAFYRSLMAYRRVFDSPDDMLVLSPDSAFFRYFEQLRPATPPAR